MGPDTGPVSINKVVCGRHCPQLSLSFTTVVDIEFQKPSSVYPHVSPTDPVSLFPECSHSSESFVLSWPSDSCNLDIILRYFSFISITQNERRTLGPFNELRKLRGQIVVATTWDLTSTLAFQ